MGPVGKALWPLYWVLKDEEILQVEMLGRVLQMETTAWIKARWLENNRPPGRKQGDCYGWSTEHV